MTQERIDAAVQEFYARVDEGARLTTLSAAGRVELERTQALVRRLLTAPGRVLDVGGATGVHATWLAADGHDVTLVDPVAEQVRRAAEVGTFEARVGDARALELGDASFDAALLLGPLYHLHARADRLRALAEAVRVVRPGGTVVAAGITRFSAIGSGMLWGDPVGQREVDLVATGVWDGSGPFPVAHLHTSDELEHELAEAGLVGVESVCVEGPMGLVLEFADPGDEELHAAAMLAAERLGATRGAKECGPHLLAWGQVPLTA